jgi:hypothetical protein
MVMNDRSITPRSSAWRPWNGGRCPVDDDAIVTVCGRYGSQKTARAADLRWSHDQYFEYGVDDIIAYMPVD